MNQGQKKRKQIIAYAFALVVISAVAIAGIRLTMAAFTANDFLKAVATTNEVDNYFASNYLTGYTTQPSEEELNRARKSLVLGNEGNEVDFTIDVYNFLQNNAQVVSTKDIEYDITIEASGVTSWSVNGTTVNGGTYTAKQLLQANAAQTNSYKISFPKNDLNNASFVIKAVAKRPTGTNLWGLARKIVTSEQTSNPRSGVTGYVQTTSGGTSDDASIADQDAYNYVLEVTGKDTKVTLSWNPKVIELEPFFREKFGLSSTAIISDGSVTFSATAGTHVINFFRAGNIAPGKVSDLGISVTESDA